MAFENTVTSVGEAAFTESIITRSITRLCDESVDELGRDSLHGCTQLLVADFPNLEKINTDAFRDCSSLDTLVLRNSLMCSLSYNALYGTPIANGTGYVYVPKSLENTYKQSSSWSALANQIRAIEDYPEVFSNLGKVWKQSNITDQRTYAVAYGNGLWQSNNYYSEDGKKWTTRSQTYDFRNFLYADGMWVARATSVYYSEDGKTWTSGGLTGLGSECNLAFGDGVWVTDSYDDGLYYSEDGKTWTQSNITSTKTTKCIVYANGVWFAAFDEYSSLWTSTDGKMWTQVTKDPGSYVKSIVYANGVWVAASSGGLYYSEDGTMWTRSNDRTAATWVGYSNGLFFAGGSGLRYSTDGKTWVLSNVTSGWWRTLYADGVWVAYGGTAGSNNLYYSDDGKVWTQSNFPEGRCGDQVCYANGVLAVATSDRIGLWYSEH